MLGEFLQVPRVAYFSMEIALRSEIQTYAGGLGVLAGDTLRSAADLRLPLVAVTLVSREGYFRQTLDAQGAQTEHPATWDPGTWCRSLDAKVAIRIEGRAVWVSAWLYVVESHLGGRSPVILLDCDLPENHPQDRQITHYLYGGDDEYRLKQEMVLGMGGVRLLHALDFEISSYHMNEGHSALLTLELLRRSTHPAGDVRQGESQYDLPQVRELCRFTTHTPVEAGHDQFPYDLVRRLFNTQPHEGEPWSGPVEFAMLENLAGSDRMNMTRLALNCSEFVNGVAKRHAETSSRMYPGYQVRAITNGVHPQIWTCDSFRALYDQHVPGWCYEPVRADCIPDASIVSAHRLAKQALCERVSQLVNIALDPDVPILGFARRMTAYKRPDLLFTDIERLRSIAAEYPFQVVLAGKAHPRDAEGKSVIVSLYEHARRLAGCIRVMFLPDYDMALAQLLVSGSDIWVNTPLPPLEASGTSGMKAAFNGVPSLSVLDGWWVEGCIEGVTGWSANDPETLYSKLHHVLLPLLYKRSKEPGTWADVMKGAISKNAAYFNSHRMMRRYATEAYLR